MTLQDITLDTNNLNSALLFYVRQLGLPVLSYSDTHLSLLMGNTRLRFQKVDQVRAPHHVPIEVFRESVPLFMKGYNNMHHLVAQTPQNKCSRLLKPTLGSSHFYDPMGNLIELIPHLHPGIEPTILDLDRVGQLEERPVLVNA